MAKRRSQRLRKKLHVGEFQELGFEFEVTFKRELSDEQAENFVDLFLAEAVEPQDLSFGGWATGGYIACYGRGSVSPEKRDFILKWLADRPEVAKVAGGELVDAWR